MVEDRVIRHFHNFCGGKKSGSEILKASHGFRLNVPKERTFYMIDL